MTFSRQISSIGSAKFSACKRRHLNVRRCFSSTSI